MDEQGTEEDPIEKAPPVPSVAKRSKAPSSKQEPPPDAEATITPVPPDDGSKAGDEVGEDAGRMLNPEDVVLEYGPQTIQSLKDSAIASGKVLWDGSLSCYGGTESAGDNNLRRRLSQPRAAAVTHMCWMWQMRKAMPRW